MPGALVANQLESPLDDLEAPDEDSSEPVASAIQKLIVDRQLAVGDRLPSERRIAEHLGVGRAAVRDAMLQLQQRGLLQIKPRSGAYIAHVPPSIISDSIEHYTAFGSCSNKDLFALRMAIEPEAAALAAQHATPEDLDRLGELVTGIEEGFQSGDLDRYVENDVQFHGALATASRNELFNAILGGLLQVAIKNAVELMSQPPSARGVYSHRPIYEAVVAGDEFWARVAMQAHMALNRHWFQRP
jgi:GntR family transcriptional repressor for pyruvate dehydrogenase complex